MREIPLNYDILVRIKKVDGLEFSVVQSGEVLASTTIDTKAVTRMRARLNQDVEFDGDVKEQRNNQFVVHIGIFRLLISKEESSTTYILTDGGVEIGRSIMNKNDDKNFRGALGMTKKLRLKPSCSHKRRRAPSSEEISEAISIAMRGSHT